MRRRLLASSLSVALVLTTALTAAAGSFHFRTSSFSGGSLVFTGIAVGLGNDAYRFDLEGTATVTAMCENKGGTQAQGRNALSVSVSSSTVAYTDSSGQAPVAIVVDDPTLASFGDTPPSDKDAGCPNGNWAVVDVTVSEWTAAQLVVTDSSGAVVFDQLYTCSGLGATLSCVEA